MNGTIRKILSAMLTVAILLAVPVSSACVSAASVDELREDLADLQKQEEDIKKQLTGLGDSIEDQQVAVKQLYKQVSNLESQIDAYQAQIVAVDKEIADQTARIETLNGEIEQKEQELKDIIEKLKKRLGAITQIGNYSSLQLLMSTENYADYLMQSYIIDRIADKDRALCDQAETEKHEIQIRKDEVEAQKEASEASKAELEALKGGLDTQFASLDKLYTTAKDKENALLKQQNAYDKKLKQIQASEDELDREIAALLNGTPPASTYGGKMYWPAPTISRISSGFGKRGSGNHYAIDISNGRSLGEPIVAAASGTVIKVQKLHYSYGNFCMIDHGLDERGIRITTLYAHMRYVPSVTVGQQVVGGVTQLGVIGNTGESYGAHLHFEVRENNKRVNPLNYVVQPK